ncbi:MAG: tetratricopeptide repeat protein [Alphaproteobacteria bacterium]
MASFESDDAPRTSGWRDLLMSLAAVGVLTAGLLLSDCLSSLPDVAQMLKEVSFGKPASSDENLVNKGCREIEAGNYAYAEIYLDSALSINPSNPFALLNLAVVYEKTVRENEARALYTALIRQRPTNIAGAVLMDENFGRRHHRNRARKSRRPRSRCDCPCGAQCRQPDRSLSRTDAPEPRIGLAFAHG